MKPEEIEIVLVNFIMYEKQGMSFYTEQHAREYIKTYMETITQ